MIESIKRKVQEQIKFSLQTDEELICSSINHSSPLVYSPVVVTVTVAESNEDKKEDEEEKEASGDTVHDGGGDGDGDRVHHDSSLSDDDLDDP